MNAHDIQNCQFLGIETTEEALVAAMKWAYENHNGAELIDYSEADEKSDPDTVTITTYRFTVTEFMSFAKRDYESGTRMLKLRIKTVPKKVLTTMEPVARFTISRAEWEQANAEAGYRQRGKAIENLVCRQLNAEPFEHDEWWKAGDYRLTSGEIVQHKTNFAELTKSSQLVRIKAGT